MTTEALLVLSTISIPWLGAVVVWMVGDDRARWQHGLAVFFSLTAAATALALLPQAAGETVVSVYAGAAFGRFTLVADGLGVFLAVVATSIGSLAVIFSIDYMRGAAQLGRYYAFILLFIGAMAGLVLSGSLLLMLIFWEITAFCSYALISFYNDDPRAVTAGVKALIMTQVGGVGLLLGTLAARSFLGDYQIETLLGQADSLPDVVLAFVAFSFLLAALAKSAQAPFHTWLPDAMEAPTPVSALIHAATMVNAGIYLLARFYPAFAIVPGWTGAVIVIGVFTALLAAVMALNSHDLKRTLAYSTVSQLGYMTYAVGIGAVFASQFHLLSHAVFKALLFLAVGAIIHSVHTRDMRQMGALAHQRPLLTLIFGLGAAALAGLPLLNGFWSKELILESGLHEGPMWAYSAMVLGAGITAAYTLRMVWLVFFAPSQRAIDVHPEGPAMRVALIPLAVGASLTWLLAGPFAGWLQATLPFHDLHGLSTAEMVSQILGHGATYVALLVVALGMLAWWRRQRLERLVRFLQPLVRAADVGFGFEALNARIVAGTRAAASALQATQTGQLNWNVAGIVLGLTAVLIWLAIGG